MPSSNTLTPTWRTARSRAPLPQLAVSLLSYRPPNTHFECCMNLVGGPCPLRSPDTSTSYESMCVPSSLVRAPLSSGSFQEVDQGSLHLPGFLWGVGVWSGMGRTYLPPLSLSLLFWFSTRLDPSGSLVLGGGSRGRVKSSGSPFPNVHLPWAMFFRGGPLERVSEPALHTDASLSHARPALDSWYWGRRHLVSRYSLQASSVLPLCPP